MEGRSKRLAGPLTTRNKRVMAAVGVLVAVAIVGLTVWGASDPGSYGRSRNGCVNINMPSSMGGAIQHECGPAARALCRAAFTRHDQLALLTQPQCRLAGLSPAPSPAPSAT